MYSLQVIDLKPGGGHIPVTQTNRTEYIELLADYYLNQQLETQFQPFREGLNEVIPLSQLRLFNPTELQALISGAEVPIDVQDLMFYTQYSGTYYIECNVQISGSVFAFLICYFCM